MRYERKSAFVREYKTDLTDSLYECLYWICSEEVCKSSADCAECRVVTKVQCLDSVHREPCCCKCPENAAVGADADPVLLRLYIAPPVEVSSNLCLKQTVTDPV